MKKSKLNRRKFIRNASFSAIGAGLVTSEMAMAGTTASEAKQPIKIKEYRKFGKTGFNISDISSGNPSSEAVLKALLQNGVNLIDTGEAYANGNSEKLIGKVIQNYNRSELFINTKLYINEQNLSKKDIIKKTNNCLERLQTDYVDCMMIHSAENTDILSDEGFHAGMEQLKKSGKVRHLGVSCHGNSWAYNTEENLETILLAAAEDGRFDVLLLAYNFVNADRAENVLDKCDKKGIATMIMKSNPIHIYGLMDARVNKLTEEGKEIDEYTQAFYDKYKIMQEGAMSYFEAYGITDEKDLKAAATKYVLSNPKAHTTIWDFQNFDDVKEMISLSGQKLSERDTALLNGYHKYLGKYTCRIGCNDCEAACPHHLPINKIMRYNYYFSAKRQEKRAMEKFARLNTQKPMDVCTSCDGMCEKACGYGVQTKQLLASAQKNMELVV
jgi:aryl-alcohol dehydrogenase-like predicted oxidoreductase